MSTATHVGDHSTFREILRFAQNDIGTVELSKETGCCVVFEKTLFSVEAAVSPVIYWDFAGGTPATTINLTRRLPPPVRRGGPPVLRERAAAAG